MKSKIKLLLSGILLVCVITLIHSCSDDESDPDPDPAPTASFTASATTAEVGEEITFTNTSEDAVSYAWSFGDATTSTAESPTKTYTVAGVFTVTLVATGPGGTDESTQAITIEEPEVGDEIYFIDADDEVINRFAVADPDDMSTFLEVVGKAGVGLAYDVTNEKIYFSDFNADEVGNIWSVNEDGTSLDDIVTDLYSPYGIALNVAAGKIYYADDEDLAGFSHIFRSNLDGSGAEAVVTVEGAAFRAVALDLVNNKMYYYDVSGTFGNLYIANLDGTSPSVVVADAYGYGIAVDAENGKIYFDEQNSEELKMANLDGTNVVTVDATASRIYGIVVDNETDKLYWSARDNGEIYQSDLDGSNKITLKDGLTSPRGIFLKR